MYNKHNKYDPELTDDWSGFCKLWLFIAAHLNTYGHPPDYILTFNAITKGILG